MPITGSVFGLNYIYDKQLENLTNNNFSSWTESGLYGYFCGGNPFSPTGTSYVSTIDRIDFSTETTGVTQRLLAARSLSATISNSSYGYFCGGSEGPGPSIFIRSSVYRLDFSNETVSNPGKFLPTTVYIASGVFNNLYGYVCGGTTDPPAGRISTISRMDFSSETFSSPGKNFSIVKDSMSSLSSTSYGYFFGGFTNPPTSQISTVSRLDFSSETVSDPGKNLPESRWNMSSTSTDLYGYTCGGFSPTPGSLCTISRIDFSTENIINLSNSLTRPKNQFGSTKSNFYGYFSGGGPTPTTGVPSDCVTVRLDFSNEICSNPGYNLNTNRRTLFTVSSTSKFLSKKINEHGYFVTGENYSTVDKLDFSTETVTNPINPISSRTLSSSTSSSSYGYISGYLTIPTPTSIDKLDFFTDSVFINELSLPKAVGSNSSVKTPQYGYFSGGLRLPVVDYCDIHRLDFSTDIISSPNKNLSKIRNDHCGTESNSYGYFAGGEGPGLPGLFSNIERLDFSTEVVNEMSSINLSQIKDLLTSISDPNKLYGYFAGGRGTPQSLVYSTVDRLDFSTETMSNQYITLLTTRYGFGGLSSRSYGYFAGGGVTSPSQSSTIERLDFYTNTLINPNTNLSLARLYPNGISNS